MAEAENRTQPINPSLKIISIASGEAHTLALTGDGKVYSWGRGIFGRLGTGSEEDRHSPVRVSFFGSDDEKEDKLKIVGIAAGAYHSLALADDGSVWGWGYNTYGQIDANGENYLSPHLLEGFFGLGPPGYQVRDYEKTTGKPLKISSVKAGGMMSLAIDNLGAMWMWGNCPHLSQSNSLVPVRNFYGHTVVKVACGNEHVVALVIAGEMYEGGHLICYSWGSNNHGQLGLGDTESRSQPEIINTFNLESPWEVYDIACGASHTALLSRRKRRSNGLESFCWTFGLGDNGQLGQGTTRDLLSPEVVRELPENVFLVSVGCGLFHTSVVSSDGEIWSWGMEKGLGLCPDARFTGTVAGDALSPLLVPCGYHRFPEPMQITCGAAHTVLLGEAGFKVWSWGRGQSGVLGNGKTIDCYVPTLVLWPLLMHEDIREKDGEGSVEIEKRLLDAMGEMKLLRSKLSVMERYAGILHGAIFGKPLEENEIPVSLEGLGTFDVAKEWENMLESSDGRKLYRLEGFYRSMLAGVKDKMMKRRVEEIVKECLKLNGAGSSE